MQAASTCHSEYRQGCWEEDKEANNHYICTFIFPVRHYTIVLPSCSEGCHKANNLEIPNNKGEGLTKAFRCEDNHTVLCSTPLFLLLAKYWLCINCQIQREFLKGYWRISIYQRKPQACRKILVVKIIYFNFY